MDLKVITENTNRLVCGINAATTVHDVIVALANSLHQTGRFYLIERIVHTTHSSRVNKRTPRILAPTERPFELVNTQRKHLRRNEDIEFHLFKSKYLALSNERHIEKQIENELVQKLAALAESRVQHTHPQAAPNEQYERLVYSEPTSPVESFSNASRSSMGSPSIHYSTSTITSS